MTWNLYESLSDAQGTLGAVKKIEKFVGDFSPTERSPLWTNIMFNFMNLAFGMAAAPMFNSFLKTSSYFATRPQAFDTLKDDTYAMLVFAVSSTKDSAQPSVSSDKIHDVVGAYFNLNKVSLTKANKDIFSGSDASIDLLYRLVNHGKLINTFSEITAFEAETLALRTLYAYLLPHVWRSKNYYPVLIDMEGPCTDVGKGNYKWTTASDAIKAGVCVNDKLYYLMALNGWDRKCTQNKAGEICHFNKMPLPPGLDKLNTESGWDITKTDIAKSAITYYNDKGGNRKDATLPDITNSNDFNKMYSYIGYNVDKDASEANKKNPAQTPGLVDIPVCKAKEVTENWKKITIGAKIDWPAFPCNAA